MKDVHISSEHDMDKLKEIQLINEYPDVFTINVVEHEIVLTSGKPIRLKLYPVPSS